MAFLAYILYLVIELLFSAVSIFVLIRFLLQCVKANFYHPLIQSLVKLTNPILLPVRRVTPIFSAYDWSCIVLVIILSIIKYCLLMLLRLEAPISPLILLGIIVLDIIRYIAYIYIFAFFIQVIASWLGSSPRQSMILALLNQLTAPLLKKIKWKMSVGVIDFKPMMIIILLFIVTNLSTFGQIQLRNYQNWNVSKDDIEAQQQAIEARKSRMGIESSQPDQ